MKNKEPYVRLPNGSIKKRTKVSIYILKQTGKEWQDNNTKTLLEAGYKSTIDPLVFTNRKGKDYIAMSIHVDEFYVISTRPSMLNYLYQLLRDKYNEVIKKAGDTGEY